MVQLRLLLCVRFANAEELVLASQQQVAGNDNRGCDEHLILHRVRRDHFEFLTHLQHGDNTVFARHVESTSGSKGDALNVSAWGKRVCT